MRNLSLLIPFFIFSLLPSGSDDSIPQISILDISKRVWIDPGTEVIELCDLEKDHQYQVLLSHPETAVYQEKKIDPDKGAFKQCHTLSDFQNENGLWLSVQCLDCPVPPLSTKNAAQIGVFPESAESLVENVLFESSCAEISNIQSFAPGNSVGYFFNAWSSINLESGALLTTGLINFAQGPNQAENSGITLSGMTDPDLQAMSGLPVLDAVWIEFDIIPNDSILGFEYVFASEEYCEYANSSFEDLFGIFISGPGIFGPFNNNAENMAWVPGQYGTPVSVTTINHLVNAPLYFSNALAPCPGTTPGVPPAIIDLGYDGYTIPLWTEAEVIPCETYHIKIAIADVGDTVFDSGVFLRGAVYSPEPDQVEISTIVPGQSDPVVPEGCAEAWFQLVRTPINIFDPLDVDLIIHPDATLEPGIDYSPLPDSAFFPAGVDTILVPITIFPDTLSELTEWIEVTTDLSCSCNAALLSVLDGGEVTIFQDTTLCWPDCLSFGDTLLCESGTYTDTIFNPNGCDTLITLDLLIEPPVIDSMSVEICPGDSLLFDSSYLTQPGFYSDTLFGPPPGCTEISILELLWSDLITSSDTLRFCTGDSVLVGGSYYSQPVILLDTIIGGAACDTIQEWVLQVWPITSSSVSAEICEGEIYVSDSGISYAETGTYQEVFANVNGCDSLVDIGLIVYPIYSDTSYFTLCQGNEILWEGMNLTAGGTFEVVYPSVNECDSTFIAVVDEIVIQSTTTDTTICEGDVIFWNGVSYGMPGMYTDTLTAVQGCDSILQLHLEVEEQVQLNLMLEICPGDTLIVGNCVITEAGSYSDILPGTGACDTLVSTSVSWGVNAQTFQAVEICEGGSIVVGNSVYFESGTYIDTLDAVSFCDSIIFTELTVIEMAVSMIDTTICAGDTLMIGNSFYTESGNYTDVVIAGNGCDSMVQTQLSIAPSYYMEIDTAVCADVLFEYAGQVYPLPGTYIIPFNTTEGCDSIVVVHLDIIEFGMIDVDVTPDDGNNTGSILVTPSGGIPPYTYQWSNGGTGPFQGNLAGGIYTVTITDSFGCEAEVETEVSGVNGVFDHRESLVWDLFPNPASSGTPGFLHTEELLSGPVKVTIFSSAGQWIGEWEMNKNTIELPAPDVQGVYWVRLETDSGFACRKWVVW
jgi:hypothetical protein